MIPAMADPAGACHAFTSSSFSQDTLSFKGKDESLIMILFYDFMVLLSLLHLQCVIHIILWLSKNPVVPYIPRLTFGLDII
jgi:hypothetical protein